MEFTIETDDADEESTDPVSPGSSCCYDNPLGSGADSIECA
jgi:hypothetical protein